MSLPGNTWLASQLLLGCCSPFSQHPLPVHHLVCLDREPKSLFNLSAVSSLLPLYSIAGCSYQVSFLYGAQAEPLAQAALPCYLIFSQNIVFLSQSADIALACSDWNTVYSFHERFTGLERQARPLVVSPGINLSILCRETVFGSVLISSRPLFQLPACSNGDSEAALLPLPLRFFTRKGLAGFCRDGVPFLFSCVSSPKAEQKPFSIPKRLALLKELYHDLAQEPARCFMLRSELLPLADGFCCCFNSRLGVLLGFPLDSGGSARTVHLIEGSISEAFEDFFSYLPGSPLVYSRAEALQAIQEEDRRLREQAVGNQASL